MHVFVLHLARLLGKSLFYMGKNAGVHDLTCMSVDRVDVCGLYLLLCDLVESDAGFK